MEWNQLTQSEQLNEIVENSFKKPVLIFKHSTRCGISRFVLRSFEKEYKIESGELKPYFLDLLKFRAISDKIASDFGVRHKSPQVLVLKNGEVILTDSHNLISAKKIQKIL